MATNSGRMAWKRKENGGSFVKLAMALVSVAMLNLCVCYTSSITLTEMLDNPTGWLFIANYPAGRDLNADFEYGQEWISQPSKTAAIDFSSGESTTPEFGQAFSEKSYADECVAGVADGDVTVDGRPLLWKLRNEIDETNDLKYFISGVEYYSGLGLTEYSFLGMGPANDSPDESVRQGLNSQGLAVGWNVLDSSGWQLLNHQALGYYSTVNQVREFLNEMTNLSTHNNFIDVDGEAVLWESQTGLDQHWEYNTRAPARNNQWIDGDNADGDGNYATGTDVSLSGWVVRANAPGHFNNDGTDDLWITDRYNVGRDVIGSLIYNNGNGTALSAKHLAVSFFRRDGLAIDNTVSNMIVQGVLPYEDPRLSTMWVLLGHTETGIFVPVWLHGVESGGTNQVPQYLNKGDDGKCVYTPAKGMHNEGYNEANVQARTLPFEEHLFDVVNYTLLPDWRNRDWPDDGVVNIVGEEMRRVQDQMDADAYWLLKYLYDNGSSSNYAPRVSIDSVSYNGMEVTISVTTYDADGDDLTYLYNYGDGQINSNETHNYAREGHYLVSCTVTDEHGISQTDWIFITVEESEYFNKTVPANEATGQSTSPVLSWGTSSGATSYQYCYDTSNDNACSNWTSNGTNTSKILSGLSTGTTYYWHVRAINSEGTIYSNGNSTAFWRFTTAVAPPAAFNKSAPGNGVTGQSTSLTLNWSSSSGAAYYEYCYDTSNDNACSNWASNGTNTSKVLSGLSAGTTYYWHIRAVNAGGTTYSNSSGTAFWSFTIAVAPPAAFNKSAPSNGVTGQSPNPTLRWGSSSGAVSYEYCYDTSNDDACSNWTSNGTNTSKVLIGLSAVTTYYWHVRAVNAGGTTYSNGNDTAFWSFTTLVNPPADFNKSAPGNSAVGQSTSPELSWGTSYGAISYEYCYDTSNDNACSTWTSNGTNTSQVLSGLSTGTTYYWHVRAINSDGPIYSNGSGTAFWRFTTVIAPPAAFNKSAPSNGVTGQSTNPTLRWSSSFGGVSYEYCYDTSNDDACSNWTSNGTDTSQVLSGLSAGTTYYWHVRAVNDGGTTYSNGRGTAFWSFTTLVNSPDDFNFSYFPLIFK